MYDTIETDIAGRVGTIRLNRPDKLNALTVQMMQETLHAATAFDGDPGIGCILVTGKGRAFAAGADIGELAKQDHASMHASDFFADWDRFAALRLPKVAAVNGIALGGGCELAMMCDVILAADTAKFGQPEIRIGCTPGIGGTQRLTRLVGRACAMDLILTGRMIDAAEARQIGLVSRVVPQYNLISVAEDTAAEIAGYPRDIAMMARACVNMAEQSTLAGGMQFERQVYHGLYGSDAQREGMAAFLQKRSARFRETDEQG